MQIKAADDKQPDIDALNALLARPNLDAGTRRRIETELRRIVAGAKGERDAAYQIEFDHGPSRKRMTIHGLRLEVEGRVAQIDHLIITRLLDIWVCESKHFADGVTINERGEWTAHYGSDSHGIASPLEQNRRHVAVLRDVFDRGLVKAPRRLGVPLPLRFKGVVLVSNGAKISRPPASVVPNVEDLDSVMKVEQLFSALNRDLDTRNPAAIAKVVSADTIERLARDLVALHKPAPIDWAARFGLGPAQSSLPPAESTRTPTVCQSCGKPVSDRVVKYCLDQAERFGGRVLCYDCQRRSPTRAAAT